MRLSILDYSPVDEGGTASEAIPDTRQLTQRADALGYERFWVSEHHHTDALGGVAPEMLMMHLTDRTRRIKVGSSGVMLPHYSSIKVAENYKMIEPLHPRRVDLEFGRAPGADALISHSAHPAVASTGVERGTGRGPALRRQSLYPQVVRHRALSRRASLRASLRPTQDFDQPADVSTGCERVDSRPRSERRAGIYLCPLHQPRWARCSGGAGVPRAVRAIRAATGTGGDRYDLCGGGKPQQGR